MSRAGDTGLKVKGGAQLISSENNRAKIHQSGWEKLSEKKVCVGWESTPWSTLQMNDIVFIK